MRRLRSHHHHHDLRPGWRSDLYRRRIRRLGWASAGNRRTRSFRRDRPAGASAVLSRALPDRPRRRPADGTTQQSSRSLGCLEVLECSGTTQNFLIFYSDLPESGEIPPPADTGLPQQLQPNQFGPIPEIGTEAFNFANYLALPGMPGWDGNPTGTSYQFISDGRVPEPGSCALLGLGGLLALMKWRKRN